MVEYRCYKDSNLKIQQFDTWVEALEFAAGDYHTGKAYPSSISSENRELTGEELREMIFEYNDRMYE